MPSRRARPTPAPRNTRTRARWQRRSGRSPSPAPSGRAAPSKSLEASPGGRAAAGVRRADSLRRPRPGCPLPALSWSVPRRTAGFRRSWRRSVSSLRQAAPARRSRARPCFNVVAVEATERQGADVGKTNPRRLELRSEGEQCKDRQLAHPLDRQIEELKRGGIGPVRILERKQDRLPTGETLELIEQCRE